MARAWRVTVRSNSGRFIVALSAHERCQRTTAASRAGGGDDYWTTRSCPTSPARGPRAAWRVGDLPPQRSEHPGKAVALLEVRASLGSDGIRHAAITVEDSGDRLLPEIPAELQASVGEDGRVDDGDARAVGGGAGRGRDRRAHPHALVIFRMRQALHETGLRLHHELHLAALAAMPRAVNPGRGSASGELPSRTPPG